MFQCQDGSCLIKEKVCDGLKDCSQGEDELRCEKKVNAGKKKMEAIYFYHYIHRCMMLSSMTRSDMIMKKRVRMKRWMIPGIHLDRKFLYVIPILFSFEHHRKSNNKYS